MVFLGWWESDLRDGGAHACMRGLWFLKRNDYEDARQRRGMGADERTGCGGVRSDGVTVRCVDSRRGVTEAKRTSRRDVRRGKRSRVGVLSGGRMGDCRARCLGAAACSAYAVLERSCRASLVRAGLQQRERGGAMGVFVSSPSVALFPVDGQPALLALADWQAGSALAWQCLVACVPCVLVAQKRERAAGGPVLCCAAHPGHGLILVVGPASASASAGPCCLLPGGSQPPLCPP